MKKIIVLFLVLLLFLSACGPKIEGLKTREKIAKRAVEIVPAKEVFAEPNATSFVEQVFKTDKIEWGFDDNKNLVRLQHGADVVNFYYKDGFLRKISDGEKSVELEYFNGVLSSASGDTNLPLRYAVRDGLLTEADDYKFAYTSDGSLLMFREALGVGLNYYYEDSRLDYIKKGNVVTHFYYNDKGQLDHVEDRNNNLVLAYGRGQKLASLSGNVYGLGEMFDYGKGRISVISNVNESVFYGDEELLKKAFDLYLSCKKFRRGYMVFEPVAFAVDNNYFNKSVYDYMLENFYCEWLP